MCEVSRVCRIDDTSLFGLGQHRPGFERLAICNMLRFVCLPFPLFEFEILNERGRRNGIGDGGDIVFVKANKSILYVRKALDSQTGSRRPHP
jgi:hypothetical protein